MSKKFLLLLGIGGIAAVVYVKRETVVDIGKLASFMVFDRVNACRNGGEAYQTTEGHYALGKASRNAGGDPSSYKEKFIADFADSAGTIPETTHGRYPDQVPAHRLRARREIDRFVSDFSERHPLDLPTYDEIAKALDMTPDKIKEILADTGGL